MKATLSQYDFINWWPESRKNQFSHDGLLALYEYLCNYEDATGEELEYDPIAICCDFTEYKSIADAYKEHYGDDSDLPEDERRTTDEQQLEYFEDNTTVLEFAGGVIIQNF